MQLPYDPSKLARQFMPINLNQPPFIPNIQASQMVAQVLPQLCAAIALEIQRNAQMNAVRVLMFNIMSENNFNNVEFNQLLNTIVLKIEADMVRNPNQMPGNLADSVVPQVVAMYAGAIAARYPDLQQFVPPQVYMQAVQAGNALNSLVQDSKNILNMAMQRMQQQATYAQPQAGFQQPVYQQPFQQQPVGYAQPMFGTQPRPDLPAHNRFFQGESEQQGTQHTWQPQAPAQPQPTFQSSSFQDHVATPPQGNAGWERQPESSTPNQQDVAIEEFLMNEEELNVTQWKATPDQPYLTGFSPRTHTQHYERNHNHNVVQIITQRPEIMDYDAHGVPYPSYMAKAPWKENFQNVADSTVKLLNAINDEVAAHAEDPERGFFTSGNAIAADLIVAESSLPAAITYLRYRRATVRQENPELQAYGALVNFQIILHEDDLDDDIAQQNNIVLDHLPFQANFIQLRDQLNKLTDEFKRLHLRKLNTILTREINLILSGNLGVGLKITNFMEDIEYIDEILLQDYGPLVLDAWEKHQDNHISRLFSVPLTDAVEVDEAAENMKKALLDRYSTVTLLTMTSTAMDIEIPDSRSVRIDSVLNPVLHELVTVFLPMVKNYDLAHRHYVVTLDGVVFEITSGWLVDDCQMIRVVGDEL